MKRTVGAVLSVPDRTRDVDEVRKIISGFITRLECAYGFAPDRVFEVGNSRIVNITPRFHTVNINVEFEVDHRGGATALTDDMCSLLNNVLDDDPDGIQLWGIPTVFPSPATDMSVFAHTWVTLDTSNKLIAAKMAQGIPFARTIVGVALIAAEIDDIRENSDESLTVIMRLDFAVDGVNADVAAFRIDIGLSSLASDIPSVQEVDVRSLTAHAQGWHKDYL